jgi:hypothetical protein
MSQAIPDKLTDQPLAEATEKYQQLIRQNRAFITALRAAIESGSETAASVTATVRTGKFTSARLNGSATR